MITLKDAVKSGRLSDFIKQEEKRGIGPASESDLNTALATVIKSPQSKDRT